MLKEACGVKKLVIRTGKTDLRLGIDRLCSIIRSECGLNPMEEGVLYLFCGTRNDRLKGLVFEGDGHVLLTKRLLKGMEFQWPRSRRQALEISAETYMELMNGCEIESSLKYNDNEAESAERNIEASLGGAPHPEDIMTVPDWEVMKAGFEGENGLEYIRTKAGGLMDMEGSDMEAHGSRGMGTSVGLPGIPYQDIWNNSERALSGAVRNEACGHSYSMVPA